jgi:hypothetical protein
MEGKGRTYDVKDQVSLASVTTILGETKDKSFLKDWKKRIGEEKAKKIVSDAAKRGTSMHNIIEGWVSGQDSTLDLTPIGQNAHSMATQIIKNGLKDRLEGYYGIEALMYYPGLYAGSADLVAKHDGEITIIDFKQTNKPKREEWIEDYFMQLAAYAMAHDYIYHTSIDKAVIMMCSVDNYYQEWIISGKQLRHYKYEFLRRLNDYYVSKG